MKAGSIFLNYRRDDTAGYAGRLYDVLKSRFPGRVFLDYGEIAPGSDFVAALENAVGQSAVLIALIGKSWLSGRLQNPADFVRLEIAAALQRNIAVIPVLVGGAALPDAAMLPEELGALVRRQAIAISDADWNGGTELLVRGLEKYVGRARKGSPAKVWAVAAAALALGIGLAAAWYVEHRPAGNTAGATVDPKLNSAMQKYVTTETKGFNVLTDGLQGVIDQIDAANQQQRAANGLVSIDALVKDKSNGRPVAGAIVFQVSGGSATSLGTTGDSGHLALKAPAGAKWNLKVSKTGYLEPLVTVDFARVKSVEIGLDPN